MLIIFCYDYVHLLVFSYHICVSFAATGEAFLNKFLFQ